MLESKLKADPIDRTKIFERILAHARTRIDKFELELLSILREELDLIACTLYSVSPHERTLSLRGQSGLAYDAYESFSLSMDSMAGRAFISSEILFFDNLRDREDYRDKILIERFSLESAIVLPIEFVLDNLKRPVCSICFYPKPNANLSNELELLNSIKGIVELAIEFSLDFTSHLLRNQIVERAIHVSDAASFTYRMLQVLKEQWNFEAGSVFLWDPRAKSLRLSGTTGLTVVGVEKRNIFYRPTETEHRTVESFLSRTQCTISASQSNEAPGKYREKVIGEYHSGLITPIFAPIKYRGSATKDKECLGVLRLVNRQIIHGDQIETADFTWEDIQVVNFLCDILGVVTHLYQRVAQKSADFERIVHGLETSILTVVAALHNVNDNVDLDEAFPPSLRHSIPDTIAFSESIHEQIRVFKLRDIQQFEIANFTTVRFVADILPRLIEFSKNSAQFFGVDPLIFDRRAFFETEEEARREGRRIKPIPPFQSDLNLILSVFKNLLDNAIKYSKPNGPCLIRLDWRSDNDFVEIQVSDNGIGVPKEDAEFIFNESYQAENAMRRRTAGTGIGLYQCRLIMERLGGAVAMTPETKNPDGLVTTFAVRIPRREPIR